MPPVSAWIGPACVAGLLSCGLARAETDLTQMTAAERTAFRAEMSAALRNMPELLILLGRAPVAPSPDDLYADDIARDLARIAAQEDQLFAPALPGFGPKGTPRLAFLTTDTCKGCATAEAELRALAQARQIRVTRIDMTTAPDLVQALDLSGAGAPFYIFPDKMVRGPVPVIVLERYLQD